MNLKLNSDVARKNYSMMISDTEIYKKLNIVLTYNVDIEIIDVNINKLCHLLISITKSEELSVRVTNNLKEEILDYLSVIVLNIFITIKKYGIDTHKNLSVVDTFIKYEEEITEFFNDGISYFYNEIIDNNEELCNIIYGIDVKKHADKIYEINEIIIELTCSITDIYSLVEKYMDNMNIMLKNILNLDDYIFIIPHKRVIRKANSISKVRQNILICY